MTQMTALTEMKIAQQAMIADVYARTYASCSGVSGYTAEVEARQAVRKFIDVMNELEPSMWYGYKLEAA